MLSLPLYPYAAIKPLLKPLNDEDCIHAEKLVETSIQQVAFQDAKIIQQLFHHFAYTDSVIVQKGGDKGGDKDDYLAHSYVLMPMQRTCYRVKRVKDAVFQNSERSVYKTIPLVQAHEYAPLYFQPQRYTHRLSSLNIKALTGQERLLIIINIAREIQRLHSKGLAHGNITTRTIKCLKQANKVCNARLDEFNHVKQENAPFPKVTEIQENPSLVHHCLPAYYSPESVAHFNDATTEWLADAHSKKANDVYALGIVCCYLFKNIYPCWSEKLDEEVSTKVPIVLTQPLQEHILKMQHNRPKTANTVDKDCLDSIICHLVMRMLHPIAKKRMSIHHLVEWLTELDACHYYSFSAIRRNLPALSEQGSFIANARVLQLKNELLPATSRIIQQLFAHFAGMQKVYIKKDDFFFKQSVLLKPSEGKFYLCSTGHDFQLRGGLKKGKALQSNHLQLKMLKLTSTNRLVKSKSTGKELREISKIPTREKSLALLFSGCVGFPRTLEAIQYTKNTEKKNYTKDSVFVEQFTGDIEKLDIAQLSYAEKHLILYRTATALKTMHDNGYVHGDIKSNNILYKIDNDKTIIDAALWDFGFAKTHASKLPDRSDIKKYPPHFFNACGWTYAPESLRHFGDDEDPTWSDEHHDRRANDMYALGIVAYRIINTYDPVWVSILKSSFRTSNPNSLRECRAIVLQKQQEVSILIEKAKKCEQTNKGKFALLCLRMLHPDMHQRLTVTELVSELEKLH